MINGPLPLWKSIVDGVHNGKHQFKFSRIFFPSPNSDKQICSFNTHIMKQDAMQTHDIYV